MHYVYHPVHGAKVVPTESYHAHLRDGWYDTPEKFPANNEEKLNEEEANEKRPRSQRKIP